MFQTKLYQKSDFEAGAWIVIRHRLFVPGWDLLPTIRSLMNNPEDSKLVLGFLDRTPMALALYESRSDMTMCFCRKDLRRKGYGSACVKALSLIPGQAWAGEGVQGTHQFWALNGVPCSRRARFG